MGVRLPREREAILQWSMEDRNQAALRERETNPRERYGGNVFILHLYTQNTWT